MAIRDVTFNLIEMDVGGIFGIIKEIEPAYEAPENASDHRFFRVGRLSVFIDRKIDIVGPLSINITGMWMRNGEIFH